MNRKVKIVPENVNEKLTVNFKYDIMKLSETTSFLMFEVREFFPRYFKLTPHAPKKLAVMAVNGLRLMV